MAQTWINVGHVAPAGTTETAVGSAVPSSHVYEVKAWVANRTAAPITFKLRHAFADAAAADDQYRAYDASVPANDIVVLPIFVMVATDKLYFTQASAGLTCIADALDRS